MFDLCRETGFFHNSRRSILFGIIHINLLADSENFSCFSSLFATTSFFLLSSFVLFLFFHLIFSFLCLFFFHPHHVSHPCLLTSFSLASKFWVWSQVPGHSSVKYSDPMVGERFPIVECTPALPFETPPSSAQTVC